MQARAVLTPKVTTRPLKRPTALTYVPQISAVDATSQVQSLPETPLPLPARIQPLVLVGEFSIGILSLRLELVSDFRCSHRFDIKLPPEEDSYFQDVGHADRAGQTIGSIFLKVWQLWKKVHSRKPQNINTDVFSRSMIRAIFSFHELISWRTQRHYRCECGCLNELRGGERSLPCAGPSRRSSRLSVCTEIVLLELWGPLCSDEL